MDPPSGRSGRERKKAASKEQIERASQGLKFAITPKKVAPYADATPADVGSLLGAPWQLISSTLENLTLRGVNIFTDERLGSSLLEALALASRLTQLDLGATGLGSSQIARLCRTGPTNIETLVVSDNPLAELPPSIARLKKLHLVNLANTRLEFLPSTITQLQHLEIELFPCPSFTRVPLAIQSKGKKAIGDFIRENALWMPRDQLTVVLIGHSGSGKTTLVDVVGRNLAAKTPRGQQSPQAGGTPPTATLHKRPSLPATVGHQSTPPPASLHKRPSLQSTVGVQQSSWPLFQHEAGSILGSVARPLPTTVLDFAGQLEYLTTHKFFLPVLDTVYLLVTDVSKSFDEQQLRLQHWISLLEARMGPFFRNPESTVGFCTPIYSVILVGTKRDLATASEQQLNANMRGLVQLIKQSSFGDSFVTSHIVSSQHSSAVLTLLMDIIRAGNAMLKRGSSLPSQIRGMLGAVEALRESGQYVVDESVIRSTLGVDADGISPLLFERTLDHLAARGGILRHAGAKLVFTAPSLIARIMALFICPLSHTLSFISSMSTPIYGGAVITLAEASSRLRTLRELELFDDHENKKLLDSLQQLDLCFEFSAQAQTVLGNPTTIAYFFPSLRPQGQLRLLHPSIPLSTPREGGGGGSREGSRVQQEQLFYSGRSFTFSSQLIAGEMFFYLQVRFRNLVDYRYKIYADSCILFQPETNSRALLSLHEIGKTINVVMCGQRLSELLNTIATVITERPGAEPPVVKTLCPYCIQGIGLYPPNDSSHGCPFIRGIIAERANEPAPAEEAYAYINDLWSPKDPTMHALGGWRVGSGPGGVRSTVLLEGEKHKAREQEWLRAKDLFYRFTAKDTLSHYELDKVQVIVNERLEKAFAMEYFKLIEKYSLSSEPEVLKLPGSPDEQFRSYCLRLSTNANINLLAGWHGTTEEICFKIGETNFHDPNAAQKRNDPGYFGKGIYFTQFPSYSAKYNSSSIKCLLLSWLLLGRVYPVIESPQGKDNLVGKPPVDGFDSHYVVVKRMNDLVYFPCKKGETPEYDELVVFRQSQILPRYVYYYRVVQASPLNVLATAVEALPPLTILWVDDKAQGEHTLLMRMWQKERSTISFKTFSSTEELRVWITNRTLPLANAGGDRAIRIITNRYRERDGGAAAAENLVRWVRNESPFKRTKILIFCSNSNGLGHLLNDNITSCTNDGTVCKNFVLATEP